MKALKAAFVIVILIVVIVMAIVVMSIRISMIIYVLSVSLLVLLVLSEGKTLKAATRQSDPKLCSFWIQNT